MLLTKLIVSIGPASWEKETLSQLIENGMNIARFNFSHADYTKTKEILDMLDELTTPYSKVATLLDTKGPEIRTGDVEEPILYTKDEQFLITVNATKADVTQKILFCDYPYLADDLEVGDRIMIDSGNLIVTVKEKQTDALLVQAHTDASIGSRRHINLPGKHLRLPALIDKDKADLIRGIEQGIDIVAASFIRTAAHVKQIRAFLTEHGGGHIPIIAKIENQEGLEHLEEIVQAADGVMIARGDLGVEIAIEDLPAYQGYIADTCKAYGTPVIYATELLKHMVDHPFPTRAEVSDIYHAVLLGHDALMLSDETAVGQYPIESLEMLGRIALSAEQDVVRSHTDFTAHKDDSYGRDKKYSIRSAHFLVDELQAVGLVLFTNSGYLAKIASAYSPNAPIYAFTPQQATVPGLTMLYGVQSFFLEENKDLASNEHAALTILQDQGHVVPGDKIVIAYDGIREGKRVAQVKVVVV